MKQVCYKFGVLIAFMVFFAACKEDEVEDPVLDGAEAVVGEWSIGFLDFENLAEATDQFELEIEGADIKMVEVFAQLNSSERALFTTITEKVSTIEVKYEGLKDKLGFTDEEIKEEDQFTFTFSILTVDDLPVESEVSAVLPIRKSCESPVVEEGIYTVTTTVTGSEEDDECVGEEYSLDVALFNGSDGVYLSTALLGGLSQFCYDAPHYFGEIMIAGFNVRIEEQSDVIFMGSPINGNGTVNCVGNINYSWSNDWKSGDSKLVFKENFIDCEVNLAGTYNIESNYFWKEEEGEVINKTIEIVDKGNGVYELSDISLGGLPYYGDPDLVGEITVDGAKITITPLDDTYGGTISGYGFIENCDGSFQLTMASTDYNTGSASAVFTRVN